MRTFQKTTFWVQPVEEDQSVFVSPAAKNPFLTNSAAFLPQKSEQFPAINRLPLNFIMPCEKKFHSKHFETLRSNWTFWTSPAAATKRPHPDSFVYTTQYLAGKSAAKVEPVQTARIMSLFPFHSVVFSSFNFKFPYSILVLEPSSRSNLFVTFVAHGNRNTRAFFYWPLDFRSFTLSSLINSSTSGDFSRSNLLCKFVTEFAFCEYSCDQTDLNRRDRWPLSSIGFRLLSEIFLSFFFVSIPHHHPHCAL